MLETGVGKRGSTFVNSAFPLGTYPTVHYEPTRQENEIELLFSTASGESTSRRGEQS
jgi:hypothetical protein